MDEQEFLHRLSIDTNVNIEFLKDLLQDPKFLALIKAGKTNDAVGYIRNKSRAGLREALMVARAFTEELK
jgi:hypothetical protein